MLHKRGKHNIPLRREPSTRSEFEKCHRDEHGKILAATGKSNVNFDERVYPLPMLINYLHRCFSPPFDYLFMRLHLSYSWEKISSVLLDILNK